MQFDDGANFRGFGAHRGNVVIVRIALERLLRRRVGPALQATMKDDHVRQGKVGSRAA